jgi:arginine-tRNA-protein transferase
MKPEPGPEKLSFFATPPHACSYLGDREATTLFADPRFPKDLRLHTLLSRNGFRRSGPHLYRPHCRECRACTPVRVPVGEYRPSRSQRRAWARNKDLRVYPAEARFRTEYYELYRRYINARHAGGGMENPTREQFSEFLFCDWADTVFLEFRLGDALMAVAVTDNLMDGCSSVYTFFDPDAKERGLGTYTIMWQIERTRRLQRPWLYLGYFIEDSRKMRYKRAFRPQEHLIEGTWRRMGR